MRKDRKLFAKAHAMRGTFCSAQGYCAACGSFGSLDLAVALRIRAGCLCSIAYSPNSGFCSHRVKRCNFFYKRVRNPFWKRETVNFSLFERKVTKEANQRAVGSLSATVRKDRKLFAKAHAMRGTFCSAQGCCAAYGSFGSLDLAVALRIRAGCLCPIANSPNS